jgi:membrane fusion protein (multidrug efflux system)
MSDAPRRNPAWRLGVGTAVLVAAALVVVALRGPSGISVSTARATRSDLLVSITSDGTLEPPAGGELRASENATVRAILASEGQLVTTGTPLVRLESPELAQSALTARSGALELAEERTRAQGELDQARRESDHLRGVFEADGRLLAQSAIARATYDADELAYRQSQDRVRQVRARYESLAGPSASAGAAASRVALSAESARELERRLAALTLRAPADGIVYGLPRKVGETVAAGQLVASVADRQRLRVRARVDQPDLPRVALGQRMVVTFDGLPDRRWEGKVLAVPSGVMEAGGRQVGEVLGEISDPHLSLPPNASVNVQIVAGEKHNALAIPRAALLRQAERRYVFVLEKGRARRREVGVGLVGLSDVEITTGLSDNDVVLIPGSVPLSDGLRVAASPKG